MKISIISGSHREPSQSMKVARFIEATLKDKGLADETWLFGLGNNPLPLWDSGVWEGEARWKALLDPIRAELAASDGLVVVSPEWHGQVPAGLKNLFLLLSRFEVGHKPALIVTLSSGDGGAYPVAELRTALESEDVLGVRVERPSLESVFLGLNDDPADNDPDADSYFRTRIAWALGILREYAIALRQVRASGVTEHEMFGNGM